MDGVSGTECHPGGRHAEGNGCVVCDGCVGRWAGAGRRSKSHPGRALEWDQVGPCGDAERGRCSLQRAVGGVSASQGRRMGRWVFLGWRPSADAHRALGRRLLVGDS